MPGGFGACLLLATAVMTVTAPIVRAQGAGQRGTAAFDGQYTGELRLLQVIQGDCTTPPLGAVYPLSVSGGQVRFAYVPRFATVLTGGVAADGSFRAAARTRHGAVEMTGQIRGNRVRAQIVSPSCRYAFETRD